MMSLENIVLREINQGRKDKTRVIAFTPGTESSKFTDTEGRMAAARSREGANREYLVGAEFLLCD